MSKWIDVDAHLAEMDDDPIIVLFRGEKMEFPAQAPAALVYKLLRIMDDEGNVALNEVPSFWNVLLGENRVEELITGEDGMTWDALQYVQNELLAAWGIGGAPEEGDSTEDPPLT